MVLAKQATSIIAPEQRFMNSAVEKGAIDASTTINSIAYMIPVIGVPKGNPDNIQSLADLGQSGLKLVIGNPDSTLLGVIAPQMFERAGIARPLPPTSFTMPPRWPPSSP
jgi:molybdate transport system substrate-binding protein